MSIEIQKTEERISNYTEQQYKQLKDFKKRGEVELNVLFEQLATITLASQNMITSTSTEQQQRQSISVDLNHLDTPPTTPDRLPIENSPPFKQQKTNYQISGSGDGKTRNVRI